MRTILPVLFLFLCVQAFSQNDFDKRLLVRYSEDQLHALANKNPDIVGYMDFYLNHGFSIIHKSALTNEKPAGKIQLKSLKHRKINIYEENLPLPLDEDVYYIIEGKNEVLVLYAREKTLNEYYENQKNNQLKK